MKSFWSERVRLLGLGVIALMLATLLAACGSTGVTETASPATTAATGATTAAGTTAAGATTAAGGTTAATGATTAAGGATGPTGDLTAGVSKKFSGTSLRVIMANHPWQAGIQKLIPQFEQA